MALRRQLHRAPELRFAEFKTADLLADRLRQAGLATHTGQAGTGVVATLGDDEQGLHVLVRADMDALPTQDLKATKYASTNSGVCHACGHDVHMAVVVGLAEHLAASAPLPGRVTFVFQPAEEIPFGEASGGQAMLDTGVLAGVDLVLGLHCWPSLPAGTIGVDSQIAMAAKSAFQITVSGVGAHAATPSGGRDALLAASQMVVALHHLHGRALDPGDRVALNVGTIEAGSSQSIVPSKATMTGTIRSVDEGIAARLRDSVERVVKGTASACGVTAHVEWKNEMPPVRNNGALVQRALDVLGAVEGMKVTRIDEPPMTADDFALYAQQRPGLYVKLGVRAPTGEVGVHPLHDGRFDVDETAIGVGVRALARMVEDLFDRGWDGAQR